MEYFSWFCQLHSVFHYYSLLETLSALWNIKKFHSIWLPYPYVIVFKHPHSMTLDVWSRLGWRHSCIIFKLNLSLTLIIHPKIISLSIQQYVVCGVCGASFKYGLFYFRCGKISTFLFVPNLVFHLFSYLVVLIPYTHGWIRFSCFIAWRDSTISLAAYQVSEIQHHITPTRWRHVNDHHNRADPASTSET